VKSKTEQNVLCVVNRINLNWFEGTVVRSA